MKIILMYILRNIGEKKFRTFLIVFSISLSCALFFASSTFTVTFSKMFEMRIRQFIGSSDYMMYANWKSPSWFVPIYKLDPIRDSLEYAVGGFTFDGSFKPPVSETEKKDTQSLSAISIDYDQIHRMNPIYILKERRIKPFRGRKIIISSDFARKYNLDLGDSLDLTLSENKYRFYIEAIAEPRGIMQGDSRNPSVLIPISMARSIFKVKNRYGMILVKVKEGLNKQHVLEELRKIYKRYTVQNAIDEEELKSGMGQITISFQIMTILVLCISVFIIYSTFKVITMERLPVIGTFRSIGATKLKTDSILLFESISYGIIGGIIGIILGFAILIIMVYIMSYNPWSQTRTAMVIDFEIYHILITFFLGIALCIVSSLVPILRITTISIKDIVLQNYKSKVSNKSFIKAGAGILSIITALVSPIAFKNSGFALAVNIFCLVISVAGVILLIPYITKGFVFIYKNVYGYLPGNIGQIAARNLRDNKSLLNTITLLCIGISSILTINTLSYTVNNDIINFYSKAKFDIWIWVYRADRNTRLRLSTVDGVTDSMGTYSAWSVEIVNKQKKINQIDGFSPAYLDFWEMEDIPREMINQLESGRTILLTHVLKNKLKVEEGDYIELKTPKGIREYKVIGFFHTNRNGGDIGFASIKNVKFDFNRKFYGNIYIKSWKNPDEVLNAVREKFSRQGFWGQTMSQMEQNNKDSNRQLFLILKGFSLLTLVIGIFGVINNYVINFIERKRSLAMYRAIGMSKIQIVKMICIEAFSGGLTGALSGIVYAMVFIYLVKYIMMAMDMYIPIRYSFLQFTLSLIAGVVISLISSISPALQSSKLNIIEAIKYE